MSTRADLRTDKPYRRIRVEPTTGYLGAEVSGVDLSKPLDDETFAEIKRAGRATDHKARLHKRRSGPRDECETSAVGQGVPCDARKRERREFAG